jgi:glycine cleavage system aminomethyltransferase T/glycine/D-amino acid oxidase-like deaminating enzyme
VIVGGGVAGASVAFHLARRGWTDLLLVDAGPLWETGGSTSHAPGLVFQLNASPTMTRLAQETIALFGGLEQDGEPCWYPVGGLEVATTPQRLAELDRRYGRALAFGVPAALLDPEDVAARIPLLDPAAVLGALETPADGVAKAVRAAAALALGAGEALQAVGGCPVTGIEHAGGRVRAVHTALGTVRTDTVVLAAGIWGPEVGATAGVRVPLVPVEHQYALTGPLPELEGDAGEEVVHPILRHQDHAMYFRQQGDAYGIGNYRHEPRLAEPEAIRSGSVLPFTQEDFRDAHAETQRLLPAVADAGIVRAFNGLMSFTPDGFPLLGESGTVRGLWLAEAIWVTHAGGCGAALAELMTEGDVRLDLHECDPRRFDAHGLSRGYARARGAQQYREVYDVIHPRQQTEQARGLRRAPVYEREVALGGVFFESAGWERPQWYESNAPLAATDGLPRRSAWSAGYWSPVAVAEHLACRDRLGIFDLTPFTKVEVSGRGALRYLQHLAANDVDRPLGTIVYTAMLAPRAGIMCDLTVTRIAEDRFWVVTGGAVGRHDIAWLRQNLPQDGSVHLDERTSALCCLGVWGPRARELLASVTEDDVSDAAFPYMTARDLHVGLVPARALRISYVGELGWELYAPTEFALALWETLWRAGEPLGMVACGGGAYDSLRLEKGYRLWGQDIDEEHDPYEAGLGWAVKLAKGPFLGSAAAAQIKERGPARRLRCMVADDPALVLLGKEPLLDGDEVLGRVTSAGYGASVGESILYGYLPVAHAAFGTRLSVYADGRRHAVTVVREPRFDPENARLKDAAPAAAAR